MIIYLFCSTDIPDSYIIRMWPPEKSEVFSLLHLFLQITQNLGEKVEFVVKWRVAVF